MAEEADRFKEETEILAELFAEAFDSMSAHTEAFLERLELVEPKIELITTAINAAELATGKATAAAGQFEAELDDANTMILKIIGNVGRLGSSSSKIAKSIHELEREWKGLSETAEEGGRDIRNVMGALWIQLKKNLEQITTTTDEMRRGKTETTDFTEEIRKARDAIKTLTTAYKNFGSATGYRKNLRESSVRALQFEGALAKLNPKITELSNRLITGKSPIDGVAKSAEILGTNLARINDEALKFRGLDLASAAEAQKEPIADLLERLTGLSDATSETETNLGNIDTRLDDVNKKTEDLTKAAPAAGQAMTGFVDAMERFEDLDMPSTFFSGAASLVPFNAHLRNLRDLAGSANTRLAHTQKLMEDLDKFEQQPDGVVIAETNFGALINFNVTIMAAAPETPNLVEELAMILAMEGATDVDS